MFDVSNFIEIQVVGVLLLIAVSPILLLLNQAFREKPGFCPAFDDISEKSAKAVILLVIAFSIGVAGNRLIDDFVDDALKHEGHEEFAERFKNEWLPQHPTSTARTLKVAEFELGNENEAARAYFERHKSLMRVLRGAAFASLLLILSMGVHQLIRRQKFPTSCARYGLPHFLLTACLLVVFALAYVSESRHYYGRVYDLYTLTLRHPDAATTPQTK